MAVTSVTAEKSETAQALVMAASDIYNQSVVMAQESVMVLTSAMVPMSVRAQESVMAQALAMAASDKYSQPAVLAHSSVMADELA